MGLDVAVYSDNSGLNEQLMRGRGASESECTGLAVLIHMSDASQYLTAVCLQ